MLPPKINPVKPIVAVKGFEITPVVFKNNGGDVTSYSVEPNLPLGLKVTIENGVCTLHGLPMQLSAKIPYRFQFANDAGHCAVEVDITVADALHKTQRGAIIAAHDIRQDLDTPRSQLAESISDAAMMNNSIKPHEKFKNLPMGDDKRLSQQTANNPEAEMRAEQSPELTPSPSAKLQAQAVLASTPSMTPAPRAGKP